MFWKKRFLPKVTFATTVWEKDWRQVLLDPDYLRVKQIGNHCFEFAEKLLVINNVKDVAEVVQVAERLVADGVLTRYVVVDEIVSDVLSCMDLKRSDFTVGKDAHLYEGVNPDWIYYNALGPLSAIYAAKGEYLLYLTGDVRLDDPFEWIDEAIDKMENHPTFKVANPVWNRNYEEAQRESYRKKGPFYVAKEGFSDQLFLVKTSDFRGPIYSSIRPDSVHFPRGDVFEKRVFSFLKNRGWERIIFRHGSYTHKNF